jgi:hypothetical protein
MEDKIYDCVLDKIVPISQATTEGIKKFWANTPDDSQANHSIGLACWLELIERGECPRPEWWDEKK